VSQGKAQGQDSHVFGHQLMHTINGFSWEQKALQHWQCWWKQQQQQAWWGSVNVNVH
jgi:hypothetical protein